VLLSSFISNQSFNIDVSKKININSIFEQNSRLIKEREKMKFTNLTKDKAESLLIPSFSSTQYMSKKQEEPISPEYKTHGKMKIFFNNNIPSDMNKNDVYLNTETPQKIERFKSLDAFPFTKLKSKGHHNSESTKISSDKPKSIIVSNEKRMDFFYNVEQDRVNDIRKYKNMGSNLNNSNSKANRIGNSLNEKSLTKKSFEKKSGGNVNNSITSNNTQIKTKRIAFIEYNKEQTGKKK
jgi:hypothetical protein